MNQLEYQDLNKKINSYTKRIHLINIISGLFFLAFLVIFAIYQFIENKVLFFLFIGFFGASILFFFFGYFAGFFLQRWYSKEIIDSLECKKITATYQYRNKHLTEDIIQESNVFVPTIDWKGRFINVIDGNYLDLTFRSFSASIYNDDKCIFNGDMYQIDLDMNILLVIRKKDSEFGPMEIAKMETGYQSFDENYEIYCNDKELFNELITIDFLKLVLEIPSLNFLSMNHFLYLGLENDYDYDKYSDILMHINDDYHDEFNYIVKIIDKLKR